VSNGGPFPELILHPGNAAFRAAADALNLPGNEAITGILKTVRPTLDLGAALEHAAVEDRIFVASFNPGAGAVTAIFSADVHAAGAWSLVFLNAQEESTGSVPSTHDAWIIAAGIDISAAASFTSTIMFNKVP